MSSYFDVVSGLPASSEYNPPTYRYYKCIQNSCNKVIKADKDTINIPTIIPEKFDKFFIRYSLKTILPITIS
jgi:hypothetical protein